MSKEASPEHQNLGTPAGETPTTPPVTVSEDVADSIAPRKTVAASEIAPQPPRRRAKPE